VLIIIGALLLGMLLTTITHQLAASGETWRRSRRGVTPGPAEVHSLVLAATLTSQWNR
jgi:hypothetical protein